MKLQLVPARTGMKWVREGIRIFMRMPLAFAGLLLMCLAATALLSRIPWVGEALLVPILLPAATVGLMAATQQASNGRFPLPATLAIAFRQSPRQTRAMLMLGLIYAGALLLIALITAALDDGELARFIAKHGNNFNPELIMADPELQQAVRASIRQIWVATALYTPVSVLLWHAPALVHWYGLPVGKSLFFSAIAVLRNARAYLVYGLGWTAVASVAWAGLLIVAAMAGNLAIALGGLLPLVVLIASMFAASLWFTFRDSFAADGPPPT
jgi:hypothetical protein